MYQMMVKENVDAVMCDIELWYNNNFNRSISPFFYISDRDSGVIYINDKCKLIDINPSACNKLFKKSIIDKYNIQFPKGLYEDHWFFYNYFIHINKIYYLNRAYYKYRQQRIGSILTTSQKREFEIFTVLNSLIPLFKENFGDNAEKSIIRVYFRLLWERAHTLNKNVGNNVYFYKFLFNSKKHILSLSNNIDFIRNNVDSFISKKDFFYQIIFGNFISNSFFYFLKRKLKKYPIMWKIKNRIRL